MSTSGYASPSLSFHLSVSRFSSMKARMSSAMPSKRVHLALSDQLVGSGDPDGGRGRDCQHYRLVTTFHRHRAGRTRRLTSISKLALPQSLWPSVASRVAAGESLRALRREYGVSHECIRRMAQAVR